MCATISCTEKHVQRQQHTVYALGTTQKSEYDKYLQKIHKKSESVQKIQNHSEFVRISYFNLRMCNQPNSLKFMKGK